MLAEYAWRLSTFGTERSAVSFRRDFEATADHYCATCSVLPWQDPGGATPKHTGFVLNSSWTSTRAGHEQWSVGRVNEDTMIFVGRSCCSLETLGWLSAESLDAWTCRHIFRLSRISKLHPRLKPALPKEERKWQQEAVSLCTWDTFVDWGCTGSPILANPLTFNANGSWTYVNGGEDGYKSKVCISQLHQRSWACIHRNVTKDALLGIMGYAVSGSSPGAGCWWGTRPGAHTCCNTSSGCESEASGFDAGAVQEGKQKGKQEVILDRRSDGPPTVLWRPHHFCRLPASLNICSYRESIDKESMHGG